MGHSEALREGYGYRLLCKHYSLTGHLIQLHGAFVWPGTGGTAFVSLTEMGVNHNGRVWAEAVFIRSALVGPVPASEAGL